VFAPEPLAATRIAARADALDALELPAGTVALRLAPDDLLVLADVAVAPDDPDAIVARDPGWAGIWLSPSDAAELLARHAEWRPPADGLAQGAVAGVPVKVLATAEATLIVVPLPFASELVERVA
jgi:hypothetical protein